MPQATVTGIELRASACRNSFSNCLRSFRYWIVAGERLLRECPHCQRERNPQQERNPSGHSESARYQFQNCLQGGLNRVTEPCKPLLVITVLVNMKFCCRHRQSLMDSGASSLSGQGPEPFPQAGE
jgi:hypothetical protein